MYKQLWSFSGPPIFSDSDQKYFINTLRKLLVTLLIISPIVMITGLFVGKVNIIVGVAIADAVVLAALWCLHHRLIFLASFALPFILLVLAIYYVYSGHGMHDNGMLIFPLAIIIAGLLLGRSGLKEPAYHNLLL